MKTKPVLLSLLAMASGICVFAQENDDMYFSSKDRAKVSLSSREEVVLASAKQSSSVQTINPSDSYSSRNENPDYIAGAKVGSNTTATAPYFTPTYQPNVNQSLYSNNCNCSNTGYNNNSAYGSPYGYSPYSSMYGMGMGYGGYGSPYSSMYGMAGMGYGMGMSYGMGYGMGMGSMMSYGMGFGYSSMYGMSPYMSMGYGMGMYGYNPYMMGYGYPSTIAVAGNEAGPVYGRHPSRTSTPSISHYATASSSRGNTAYYNNSSSGARSSAGSRVASNSTSYYNNTWKQSSSNARSSWGNAGSNSGARSTWSNSSSRSTWSNPSFGNSSFGGARSSGFSGGGGGGFSGGGGGHSGGGGHGRR